MKAALGVVVPPRCPGCGASVAAEGGLCPDCWREAEFIGACACATCGVPLPGDGTEAGLRCDDCLTLPRPWEQARAALVYAGTGRRLEIGRASCRERVLDHV